MISNPVKKVAAHIKSMRLQSPGNIRKAIVKALLQTVNESKATSNNAFIKELKENMRVFLDIRTSEPSVYTTLRILLQETNPHYALDEAKSAFEVTCRNFEKERSGALKKIAESGAKKIRKNSVVLTHSQSHTVEAILIEAWKKKKLAHVYVTETRPGYEGRQTAQQLAAKGIPVTLIVDSAARTILHDCDLFLTGADAILEDGSVVNDIGTSQISLAAFRENIPHYVAGSTHKFDPETFYGVEEKIEKHNPKLVWEKKVKNLEILNPGFDVTESSLVREIITDKGVFGSEAFAAYMYQHLQAENKTLKDVSLFYLLRK